MWENNRQVMDILENVTLILTYLKSKKLNWDITHETRQIILDMEFCVSNVNKEIYGVEYISKNKSLEYCKELLNSHIEIDLFITELESWKDLILNTVNNRNKINDRVDFEFFKYIDHLEMISKNELIQNGINSFKNLRVQNVDNYYYMCKFYNTFSHFWGNIDIENNIYDLFEKKATALKEHTDDFLWLYNELGDYRSKLVLTGIIKFWESFDMLDKKRLVENNFEDYYDFDLISCDENEVFVDIGAYNGDSTKGFIKAFNKYKSIYCYEITPKTILELKENLNEYENIHLINKAVGSKKGIVYLADDNIMGSSSNRVVNQGNIPIEVVTIDDDIKEKITFIKMDIEGSEKEALIGCRRHIIDDMPKLAICTYHNNEDIWKIPRMIKQMNPDYKLYMRYNGSLNGFAATEFVTFALNR